MSKHLRLARPIRLAHDPTFRKFQPEVVGELYLSYAGSTGGRTPPRIVTYQVQYVGSSWGVARTLLACPARRRVWLMDYGTVIGSRRPLLLGRSRAELPFMTTGPRPWELRHRQAVSGKAAEVQAVLVSGTEQASPKLPVSPNSVTTCQNQLTEAVLDQRPRVGRRKRSSA